MEALHPARQGSFFGMYLVRQLIHSNHLRCKLNEIICGKRFAGKLIELCRVGDELYR